MPLEKITPGDLQAREKTNDAFDKVDELDAGLPARALYSEVGPMRHRPGEPGRFFTGTLDGEPSAVAPIDDGIKLLSADGRVAQLAGAGRLAPIAVFRVEPGRQYRARFVFRRSVDSEDPAGDAVQMGLRWLKNDKAGLSSAVLANLLDLRVANGRLDYSFNFATVDADDIDAAAPAGAIYVRPYLRTFGFGTTRVEVIEVTDLSGAVDYSPDLSALQNEVAGLTQRLDEALDRIAALEA